MLIHDISEYEILIVRRTNGHVEGTYSFDGRRQATFRSVANAEEELDRLNKFYERDLRNEGWGVYERVLSPAPKPASKVRSFLRVLLPHKAA